jgi:hypothetical protein
MANVMKRKLNQPDSVHYRKRQLIINNFDLHQLLSTPFYLYLFDPS